MTLRFVRIAFLLLLLVAICAAVLGFRYAEAIGEAALAQSELNYERTMRGLAESRAERDRQWRLAQQDALRQWEGQMRASLQREQNLSNDRVKLRQEIAAYVAQNKNADRACPGLDDRWLRAYNKAFGLAGAPAGAAMHADGGRDLAGSAGAPDAGVQPGPTPADIIAHVETVGAWCLTLESRLRTVVTPAPSAQGATP